MPMHRIIPMVALGLASILAPLRGEEPTPGKQVEQQFKSIKGIPIDYLLYLPQKYETGASWPVLLFLHGRGESDGPLALVKKWGPPRLIDRGENFPYIVLSPQCPRSPESWPKPNQQALLLELFEHT